MQDVRTRWTLIGVVLLVALGSGVGLWASRRNAPPPIVITQPTTQGSLVPASPPASPPATPPEAVPEATSPPPAKEIAAKPAPAPRYYVHVAGAVKHPSLYLLAPGSRVMHALKAAGGPTSKADLDAINLAEKVTDGEKIFVPAKAPAAPMLAPPGNVIGHESVKPGTAPAPPAPAPVKTAAAPPKPSRMAKAAGTGKPAKLSSPSQGQININTADADQLQRLPGIGPAMAERVIAYRQQAGGFQKIEDLQEVSGIGPKKYAKIAPLVKL